MCTDVHLTNVAVQKTAPDYDPEKVCGKYTIMFIKIYFIKKQ